MAEDLKKSYGKARKSMGYGQKAGKSPKGDLMAAMAGKSKKAVKRPAGMS